MCIHTWVEVNFFMPHCETLIANVVCQIRWNSVSNFYSYRYSKKNFVTLFVNTVFWVCALSFKWLNNIGSDSHGSFICIDVLWNAQQKHRDGLDGWSTEKELKSTEIVASYIVNKKLLEPIPLTIVTADGSWQQLPEYSPGTIRCSSAITSTNLTADIVVTATQQYGYYTMSLHACCDINAVQRVWIGFATSREWTEIRHIIGFTVHEFVYLAMTMSIHCLEILSHKHVALSGRDYYINDSVCSHTEDKCFPTLLPLSYHL